MTLFQTICVAHAAAQRAATAIFDSGDCSSPAATAAEAAVYSLGLALAAQPLTSRSEIEKVVRQLDWYSVGDQNEIEQLAPAPAALIASVIRAIAAPAAPPDLPLAA